METSEHYDYGGVNQEGGTHPLFCQAIILKSTRQRPLPLQGAWAPGEADGRQFCPGHLSTSSCEVQVQEVVESSICRGESGCLFPGTLKQTMEMSEQMFS